VFVDVSGARSREEIYNRLYPAYVKATRSALKKTAGGPKNA